MAVMAPEAWTDGRLDDLNRRVDEGFKETRVEFRAARAEIGEVRSEVHALTRVVAQLAYGLIGTLLAGFLGIAATLAVKL
jgi:hypothetical protein